MGENTTRSSVPVSVDKLASAMASGPPVSVAPEYHAPVTTTPSPVLRSPNQTGAGCTTCGHGGDGIMLHRLKHDGVDGHHCSSCILLQNKGMYCSQCFQIYPDSSQLGDSGMWLTCSICQRLSHLQCAHECSRSTDSASFMCHYCKRAAITSNSEDGAPPHKKAKLTAELEGSNDLSDQEVLAAAQIVAALAAKRAKDARARARASAAAAVMAADRAKAALDAAHRACREELKWRAEAGRQLLPDGRRATVSSAVEQKVSGGLVRPSSNVMDTSRSNIAPRRIPVEALIRPTRIPSTSVAAPQRVSVITKQPQKPVRGCVSVDGSSLGAVEGDTVAVIVSPASTLEAASSLGTPTFSMKASGAVNANSLRSVANAAANESCSYKKGPVVPPHADGKLTSQTDTRGMTSLTPSVTEVLVAGVADVPPLTSSSDIEGKRIEGSTDLERNTAHVDDSEGETEQVNGDLGFCSDQQSPGQPSGETVR